MLIWEYEPSIVDAFHVYRRVEGETAQRLTSEALSDEDGRIDLFSDIGEVRVVTRGPEDATGDLRVEVTLFERMAQRTRP